MKIPLIILACIAVGLVIFFWVSREVNSPLGKPCSVCGVPATHGYSDHAEEDADKIKPMCLSHLLVELERDYPSFRGRAVVIEPAADLPCYVFQPLDEWRQAFQDSKIPDDVSSLLAKLDAKCYECAQPANYLWIESKGFTGDNFTKTLDRGLTRTILWNNPAPISLCPKCCIRHVAKALDTKHLSYLEVCGPKGNVDGFVIPMGY